MESARGPRRESEAEGGEKRFFASGHLARAGPGRARGRVLGDSAGDSIHFNPRPPAGAARRRRNDLFED